MDEGVTLKAHPSGEHSLRLRQDGESPLHLEAGSLTLRRDLLLGTWSFGESKLLDDETSVTAVTPAASRKARALLVEAKDAARCANGAQFGRRAAPEARARECSSAMGASVSLPGPFKEFSRMSLADVDEMIIRHRKQCDGAFMVTPQQLEVLLGPKLKQTAPVLLSSLEGGDEGKVNALSFLCGAVAMCRTDPPKGGGARDDGVKEKARRLFALFDFGRARALTSSELGILLLSLGRALEGFMGLKRGQSCVAFVDMAALDNAARVRTPARETASGPAAGRGRGPDDARAAGSRAAADDLEIRRRRVRDGGYFPRPRLRRGYSP